MEKIDEEKQIAFFENLFKMQDKLNQPYQKDKETFEEYAKRRDMRKGFNDWQRAEAKRKKDELLQQGAKGV